MYMMGVMFLSAMAASMAVMKMHVRTDKLSSIEAPKAELIASNFVGQHQAALAFTRDKDVGGSPLEHGETISLRHDILQGDAKYQVYLPEYTERCPSCPDGSYFTSEKFCIVAPLNDCEHANSENYLATYGPVPQDVPRSAVLVALGRVSEYTFSAGEIINDGVSLRIRSSGAQVSHDGTVRGGTVIEIPTGLGLNGNVGDMIFLTRLR